MSVVSGQSSVGKEKATDNGLLTTDMFIRIHNRDNRAVRGRVFALERKARFLAAAPENKFAHARAGRINSDHRLALWRQIFVQGLNNQQLAILE